MGLLLKLNRDSSTYLAFVWAPPSGQWWDSLRDKLYEEREVICAGLKPEVLQIERQEGRPATKGEVLPHLHRLLLSRGINLEWTSDINRRAVVDKLDLEFKLR